MEQSSKMVYLKDYKKPDYLIKETQLDFVLDEKATIVTSLLKMSVVKGSEGKPLFLNGDELKLLGAELNGKPLGEADYLLDDNGFTLKNPPAGDFTLGFKVQINPSENTALFGLYMSEGIFCTQCEPEGFRRITFYHDNPDVLSKFRVTIHADKSKYPLLLSNGNLVEEGDDYVVWEDPFAKPCYLFALVAADNYDCVQDKFVTMSGREVTLRVYGEKSKKNRLNHAMTSLKQAFAWDEEKFGREYDLDLFNLVAVHDFNQGAMENKSLNIFNEKLVLADNKTVTDADYHNIQSVVGHEYFHNWTGDRVTARDWFNLSLKEGLTVYRDQEFSSDMSSRPVQRINDVVVLRAAQFPEDAGPLAHPVRPEKYMAIDNFYTATVYEKGAEVIRMQEKILGRELFRKGMDLYFERYDGQAVTIDDFVSCMEAVSGMDLTDFKRWYSQSGTPSVTAETSYDEAAKIYRLRLSQSTKPDANQSVKLPFVIPLKVGLIGSDGKDMPLHLQEKDSLIGKDVLILNKDTQEFVFTDVNEKPILSLNREFTAPIRLNVSYSGDEIAFLMVNDSDSFNRWEAGQKYASNYIFKLYDTLKKGEEIQEDVNFLNAFAAYLDCEDKAFAALALRMPTIKTLADNMDKVDMLVLAQAHRAARESFAKAFKDKLLSVYEASDTQDSLSMSKEAIAERALRNQILAYLGLLGDEAVNKIIRAHYTASPNMTNIQAALSIMVNNRIDGFEEALGDIYWYFKADAIVMNRWLLIQALAEKNDNLLQDVKKLMGSEVFTLYNPNNVYSLIGGFAANTSYFHAADGSGYAFLADVILKIDDINALVAARLATSFSCLPKMESKSADMMKKQMERILKKPNLSSNVYEIISKIMGVNE